MQHKSPDTLMWYRLLLTHSVKEQIETISAALIHPLRQGTLRGDQTELLHHINFYYKGQVTGETVL